MKHTYTRIAAAILSAALPLTAIAAPILQADPSIAGLGLDVALTGGPADSGISIIVKDPKGRTTTMPVQTDANGRASASLDNTKTQAAGEYAVSAVGSDRVAIASANTRVDADTMDPWTSVIQSWTPRIDADGTDEAEILVTLRDRYGNVLEGRPVAVISNRPDDVVEAVTPQTDIDGVQHFAVSTEKPGLIQLRAVDLLSGNTIVESAEINAGGYAVGGYETTNTAYAPSTVSANGKRFYLNAQLTPTSNGFGVLDGFEVTAPSTLNTNEDAPKVTIRAVDAQGKTVENYNGTVTIVTTDPQATVPNFGSYTFRERDLGVKDFPLALRFRTAGEQTIRVQDQNDNGVFGEAVVNVGGNGGSVSRGITITSHDDGDYVNSTDIVIEGVGPRFSNLIVMGGAQDVLGSTNEDGSFSIPVALNPSQRDFTIRVQDDAGRYDSGSLHLILDQTKPEIKSIQFVPKDPEEGEKVLIVVETEDGAQALVRIPNLINGTETEYTLNPVATLSGSYQGFFDAPNAGSYQPAVVVMDKAGNIEEVRSELNVRGKTLPIVQNVQASPRVDSVELTWDAVSAEVTGYRVYVGEDPSDFYSLDTDRAVTKATVKGLTPGKTYYFGVTALNGSMESEEKSALVEAQVLGFKLEVTAQANALNVTWTTLTTDLPLSSFLLEYGVSATDLNETRMLNGELRDYTIRDLLSGVQYFIRVTPVTVTGDKLDELAAEGDGTPEGEGFVAGPRDDIPFDDLRPGAPNEVPSLPNNGVSSIAWMSAIALGVIGVLYQLHRRKNIRQTAAFLQAVQSNYRVNS